MVINNVSVKAPQTLSWSLSDLSSEDSVRDLNGTMTKDVIAQKVKLECAWGAMTVAEASKILQAVNKNIFFPVTYLDPLEGTNVTKTFYVGDRSSPILLDDGVKKWVQGVSFNFVER